jgi:Na+/melibiose symporter-like transporter
MRHTLARALSIIGHPVCVVPMASLLAIASHALGLHAVWVTAIFFVSLSLIVLAFAWRQVRAGRWQDIDASKVTERRSLYSVSDLPKSTNFDIGALCLDIPESMRKDCSIM